jgi:hypothetical protein
MAELLSFGIQYPDHTYAPIAALGALQRDRYGQRYVGYVYLSVAENDRPRREVLMQGFAAGWTENTLFLVARK